MIMVHINILPKEFIIFTALATIAKGGKRSAEVPKLQFLSHFHSSFSSIGWKTAQTSTKNKREDQDVYVYKN